jgi:hypothetical protein
VSGRAQRRVAGLDSSYAPAPYGLLAGKPRLFSF